MKNWILNNCIRKDGRITSHASKIEWYEKRNLIEYYNKIINYTNFLPINTKLLERIYCILNDITERKKCIICDNHTTFKGTLKGGYHNYCTSKCSQNDKKLQEIKNLNYKQACLEKYGVDNTSKLDSTKEKIKTWYKEKYTTRIRISDETLSKYHELHLKDKIPITVLSKQLGFSSSALHNILNRRGFKTRIFCGSHVENIVVNFINSLNVRVIEHDRKILNGKELDILLPDHNLAIEINGLYWHNSELKDKNHLIDKTIMCKENGISLLHFYDVEITEKFDIVKSIIKSKLNLIDNKIFARNTIIKEIDDITCKNFLNTNHIQGYSASSIRYGLYYEDKLVSIMTFAKSRFNKNYDWELVRFCNLLDTVVIGGASKLFNYFLKNIKNESIVSYCDLRYFDGNIYNKLGFDQINISSPNYFYFERDEYKLHNRIKFQKHKLKNLLPFYDNDISEWENMKNNGYFKIYDCGNNVYKYIKT